MTLRENIMAIAAKEAELGIKEDPPNSNKTKYGKWFGLDGVAWCGIFCSWCYYTAGRPITGGGYLKGFAGVETALATWKDKITTNPQPADLVIFDWDGNKKPDHVALFLAWIDRSAGTFYTIEGNTSPTNQSNGGQVMKRQRNMAKVEAFINLIG